MNNFSVKLPIFRKIFGVIRLLIIKLLQGSVLQTKGMFLVEKGALIHAKENGAIQIGKKAHLFPNTELQSRGKLVIGDHFSLNRFSRVIALDNIKIGSNVTIAQFVSILDHDHNYYLKNDQLKLDGYTTQNIRIGSNVWIGDKVTILKGVVIGDNVIIGANSLVNKNIESNSIAAGNPIKIIKKID